MRCRCHGAVLEKENVGTLMRLDHLWSDFCHSVVIKLDPSVQRGWEAVRNVMTTCQCLTQMVDSSNEFELLLGPSIGHIDGKVKVKVHVMDADGGNEACLEATLNISPN